MQGKQPPVPASVLLATDLSPRCDRAYERALQLVQSWQAHLTALNVFDAPKEPDQIIAWAAGDKYFDPQHHARQQLQEDLSVLGERATIRLATGSSPATVIRQVARETGAGLVVLGVARDEPLGRFLLGSNVEQLARAPEQPLLVVRNRVRGPYRRIVVSTDLSSGSGAALAAAVSWFPDVQTDLFHAVQQPAGLDVTQRGKMFRSAPADVHERCEQFVQACGLPRHALRRIVAQQGVLELALTHHVRHHAADLVVMGVHESIGFFDTLLGNSFSKLLQWVSADVLVVPDSGGE